MKLIAKCGVLAVMSTVAFAGVGVAQHGGNRGGGGDRGGGRNDANNHDSRGGARTSVNVNVDHGGYGRGGYRGGGYGYRDGIGVGGALVAGLAIGAAVRSLPPSCSSEFVNGVTYQQCGSTWYEPQFVGSTPNYIVVAPLR